MVFPRALTETWPDRDCQQQRSVYQAPKEGIPFDNLDDHPYLLLIVTAGLGIVEQRGDAQRLAL